MRKVAYSTNQFGLDLLRASDKNDKKPLVFCPFCISSSLVMLLIGSQNEMANSLRHALYLNPMTENEINFAYFDMMNHLGVNLPTQKQTVSTNQLNFKTPVTSGSGNSLNVLQLDLLNKAGLLSSESQNMAILPNNYLTNVNQPASLQFSSSLNPFDSMNNQKPASGYEMNNQLFQSLDYLDRNKLNNPFSPLNEHRNNFIKFSQISSNSLNDPYSPGLDSNINNDIKTSNYLFGRNIDRRISRAFGFKNGFWNSGKSYLNPFGTMLNAFQNNFQNQFQYATSHPSNYHPNGVSPGQDILMEKFGQNINHQAFNNIKLPNHFHYYHKHISNKPSPSNQDNQRLTTTSNSTSSSTNKKATFSTISSSTSSITTTEPSRYYSTINNQLHHHHNFNTHHVHLPNIDNSIAHHHTSVRLGTNYLDNISNHHLNSNQNDQTGNDISFLSNIYVQRDFAINYHYHILLNKFYKTAIHPLDFIHNGEETRQHINSIVEMQTDNKICNILPERQSPSTQLLLVSALYFKGELDLKMNVTKTKNNSADSNYQNKNQGDNQNGVYHHVHNSSSSSPIRSRKELGRNHVSNEANNQEDVWMEASKTRLRYAFDKYLNCSTVEMPFKDSMITLVVMIPADNDGLDTLLTKLNAQMLNDVINSLEIKRVTIKVSLIFIIFDSFI